MYVGSLLVGWGIDDIDVKVRIGLSSMSSCFNNGNLASSGIFVSAKVVYSSFSLPEQDLGRDGEYLSDSIMM